MFTYHNISTSTAHVLHLVLPFKVLLDNKNTYPKEFSTRLLYALLTVLYEPYSTENSFDPPTYNKQLHVYGTPFFEKGLCYMYV